MVVKQRNWNECCLVEENLKDWDCGCSGWWSDCSVCKMSYECKICHNKFTSNQKNAQFVKSKKINKKYEKSKTEKITNSA